MQLRYLPIGSVCSIDNSNNKYMVIGYKKNDYNFVSVLYPDGFLDSDNLIYFNEGQITEIYSLGYKDEYGIMYSKKINIEEKPVEEPQSGDGMLEEDKSIFEGPYEIEEQTVESINENNIDNNTVEIETKEENNEMRLIKNDSPYIFNSEGLVVAIKPQESSEEKVVEEPTVESTSPYVFDENGTIIAVNEPSNNNQPQVQESQQFASNDSPYIFDSNGTVIGINEAAINNQQEEQEVQSVENTSPYVFDENGTIVAVNEPSNNVQPQVQEVENSKYYFDENGFLVSKEQ